MKNLKHSASALALAVATTLVTAAPPVMAQDSQTVEEIVVTGIRGSLTSSMDTKRNADGVVDAITAEDIGKFPDANLAESLQRITGVSIDRANNEGNQITVRGLGPNFNMVTLNGRQMPAASSPEQESITSATQSRAFNFNQIASESVSGVTVHKTARANLPPGGIGATVDIKTARPFDYNETQIVFNAATIHDPSNEKGDDFTPEIGGLFSTTFADGKVGVLANVSYSERNFSEPSSHTDGWLRDDAGSGAYNAWCSNIDCTDVPYIYRSVSNIGEIQHFERKRTNGVFVAQFAPSDAFEVTVDYVFSDFELDSNRFQTGLFGVVEGNTVTNVALDENFSVLRATRTDGGATVAADALAQQNQVNIENKSLGLNLKWHANDNLTVTFDAHDSEAVSQPNGELNERLYLIQGPYGATYDLAYSGTGVDIAVDNSGAWRGTCQYGIDDPGGFGFVGELGATEFGCSRGTYAGFQDPNGFAPLGTVLRTIAIDNTVEQYQLDATWSFDETTFSVGASWTDYGVETLATNTGFQFQGLYPCFECGVHISAPVPTGAPSGFLTTNEVDFNGFLNAQRPAFLGQDFANLTCCGDGTVPAGSNFAMPDDLLLAAFPPTFFGSSEQSTALYINLTHEFELGGMPAGLSAGLRYESTDVEGSAFQNFPVALQVTSTTEGQVLPGPEETFFVLKGDYSVFLPALDFRIEPREDHVLRVSYGKSIARPDLNGLRPTTNVSDYRPGAATASSGNPDLNPYLADNFDLSWEWYYDDGSYVSVAYFYKQISDYIGTDVVQDVILDANGEPLRTPEARFDPNVIPNVPVISEPTDPILYWDITRLVNGEEREVDGFELAVQHLFGDTGFGMQANYTVVDTDAQFDPNEFGSQAILIGLSDSWNLVGFYENDLFSVRVAANYRDKFLFATNQLRATNEPVYFDEYLQVDLSASWYINDSLTANFEVLNMTGEDQLQTGRYANQFLYENAQEPRYILGLRARF
jgi:TonB-dependent receptor